MKTIIIQDYEYKEEDITSHILQGFNEEGDASKEKVIECFNKLKKPLGNKDETNDEKVGDK